MSESEPTNYYSFTAQAGESVTILAGINWGSSQGDFRPLLELYTANGTLLGTNTGSTGAIIRTLRLTNDGDYVIVCRATDPATEGAYGLTLIKFPGCNDGEGEGGTIASGQNKSGQLPVGDVDAYCFAAQAGESVTILAGIGFGSSGDFQPLIELYTVDGRLVAYAQGISPKLENLCVSEAGTYMILIRAGNPAAFGVYNLRFRLTPLPDLSVTDLFPKLAIVPCENNVVLYWRTNAVGFHLEKASELPSTNWLSVMQEPQIVGELFSISEPVLESRKFYRLKRE